MATEWRSSSTSPTERQESRALVVGSLQGDVAVVQAQTGACLWHQQTDRRVASLTQDGERFYLSVGESLSLLTIAAPNPTSEPERARVRQRLREEADAPTPLICRRLDDGSLVWTQTDWSLTGYLHLAMDGNTLLAGSYVRRLYADAVPPLYALDTASGRVLWTLPADHTSTIGLPIRTGGGRVFVQLLASVPNQTQVLQVLETRTGRELWRIERGSIPCLSRPSGGLLVAQQQPGEFLASVLRSEDGTQLSQFRLSGGGLHLFTDDGVAYSASTLPDEAWVEAVDATGGGRELWRAEGVLADCLALDGDQLYYARVRQHSHLRYGPAGLAEVGVLDVQTGRRLWTWHSPRNTAELLQLWGSRTPAMLVDSARKSWATITDVLADRRHRTIRLLTELHVGQWRRPYSLHRSINALWLEARDGLVYVGTRLGLFALDGKDGTVKWHAMPDLDLSFVLPAMPPR